MNGGELAYIKDLGVSGFVVYLVIKEMFAYLKSRKNGNGKSNLPIIPLGCPFTIQEMNLWQTQIATAIATSISVSLAPPMQETSKLLAVITHNQEQFLGRLASSQDDIRKAIDRIEIRTERASRVA
jgi:hypothetical protein